MVRARRRLLGGMFFRLSGLVKDGARRRRSAVTILDEAGQPEKHLSKRLTGESERWGLWRRRVVDAALRPLRHSALSAE